MYVCTYIILIFMSRLKSLNVFPLSESSEFYTLGQVWIHQDYFLKHSITENKIKVHFTKENWDVQL